MTKKESKQPDSLWHAFYVKSRNEKKVTERLELKGFEVYTPLQTVLKQWSDRKKKVQEPLFKSYVFVRFKETDKLLALQTPGVVGIVRWLGKPAIIRDEEIKAIKDFLAGYKDVKVENLHFKEGETLRVKTGQLAQEHGVVIRQSKHKVILQLEKLGMSLTAEVPKSQVEKLA
jgi:transcription antitermination factor NusG